MAWRDALENIGHGCVPNTFGVLASQTMEGGNFACGITTDSFVRPGADTANFLTKGIVPSSVTSVVEGLVSGTHNCQVISGIACWMTNDGTNPVVKATDQGHVCYVKSATSVCAAAGSANSIVAGIVLDVDATKGVKIWIPAGGYPA